MTEKNATASKPLIAPSSDERSDSLTTVFAALSFLSLLGLFLISDFVPALDNLLLLGTLGGLYAAFAVGSFFAWRKLSVVWLMAIVIVGLALVQGSVTSGTESEALFRYITALIAIFFFVNAPIKSLHRIVQRLALIALLASAAISITRGTIAYAGTTRLALVWEGLHSTSISIAAFIVIIVASDFRRLVKVPVVLLGLGLLVGYGVTTAYLMAGFFIIGYFFEKRGWRRGWFLIIAAVGVVGSAIFRDESDNAANTEALGIGALGSGRLDSWMERFQRFSDRNLGEQLFGTGPFSDYVATSLWWWEAKNAHSDPITLLMEFGIIGLGIVLFTGFVVWRRSTRLTQLALAAVLLGATGSNALLDRPIAAIFWGVAIYAVAGKTITSRRAALSSVPSSNVEAFLPEDPRSNALADRTSGR